MLPGANDHTYELDGVRLHAVEMGEGPPVLFIHGFPESWYSWRHQLPAVAEAGHRAIAIDVRGYGRSSKPGDVSEYRLVRLAADIAGLIEHLDAGKVVLVGHDWGAPIAWTTCNLRPDLVSGLVLLSVPYTPPSVRRPSQVFAELVGPDHTFYITYFSRPEMELEVEEGLRGWLAGFFLGASGDAPAGMENFVVIPKGTRMRDLMPDAGDHLDLPWMTPDDFEFYVSEFERTGLTSAFNRYRNVDRDWEDLAALRGAPIALPALFVGGEKDGPTIWGARAIARFDRTLPNCRGVHILEGAGHWIQQERAGEVNRLLVEFLAGL